jgi:hypothetical protein
MVWRLLDGNVVDSNVIRLLVLLARIQEMIMADKLTVLDIDNFQDMVIQYFELRRQCAAESPYFCKMTPKYHYLGKKLYYPFNCLRTFCVPVPLYSTVPVIRTQSCEK